MKCEYFSFNFLDDSNKKIKSCDNQNARYFTCDFINGIVCEKHRCRCYKKMTPLTDEQIEKILKDRQEKIVDSA